MSQAKQGVAAVAFRARDSAGVRRFREETGRVVVLLSPVCSHPSLQASVHSPVEMNRSATGFWKIRLTAGGWRRGDGDGADLWLVRNFLSRPSAGKSQPHEEWLGRGVGAEPESHHCTGWIH